MGVQRRQGLRQGVHLQRPAAVRAHRVQHQRQDGDVVEVRMREEHMVDALHFLQRELAHAGTRVDQDMLAQQKRGGAAPLGDRTAAAEDAYLHVPGCQGCGMLSLARTPSRRRPAQCDRRS